MKIEDPYKNGRKEHGTFYHNLSKYFVYFIILLGNKRDTRGGYAYIFNNPAGAMNSKH